MRRLMLANIGAAHHLPLSPVAVPVGAMTNAAIATCFAGSSTALTTLELVANVCMLWQLFNHRDILLLFARISRKQATLRGGRWLYYAILF